MRAALILRLARTRRWAIVDSGTRNDRATSSVDSPPSSRSVRATCASVDSAGWQQVKIRRRRSSFTGPTSTGTGSLWLAESTAISPSSSRPRASRRRRSMARLRAVVVIQPPGLGGSPCFGQSRSATANASCTASSATSMSPKTRIRMATDRPHSPRKIRPISNESSRGPTSRTRSGLAVAERTDLDRPTYGGSGLRRPCERGVEILGLDDVEATEVLLRLGEGAVRRQHLAPRHAHDGRSLRSMESASEHPRARRLDLLIQDLNLLPGLLHLFLGHLWGRLALD